VVEAGSEILKVCAEVGGSISGEHGIGLEKMDYMPFIFSEADLTCMRRVKEAFNPTGLCNPGKIFPTKKACVEVGPAYRAHPIEELLLSLSGETLLERGEGQLQGGGLRAARERTCCTLSVRPSANADGPLSSSSLMR
jgi:hypothetical protein